VIGIAPNLFYGTGIPAAILIFNRAKARNRRGKVLFVDASGEFQDNKKQNKIRDADIQSIVSAYQNFVDIPQRASVVEISAIAANDFNLNISRYVTSTQPEPEIDLHAAIAKLRELEADRSAAEAEMNRHLRELGFEV
jgi:type I restriction enzyme M protein